MSPGATIVVEATFRDGYEAHFADYSRQVREYLARHGGQVIRRQRIERTLYGPHSPSLIMLIDFPERETAERIFSAPDYLAIVPLREKVFSDFRMYLAEPGEI